MDIGNSTYTEYDTADPKFISHLMANKELLMMKRGHIHSHNSMSVFFSGTDDSELVENAPHHNIYVSLIVNNDNDMCAKVAFAAKCASKTVMTMVHKDENGNDVSTDIETTDEKETVYAYECAIEKPVEEDVTDAFAARFQEVQEEKVKSFQVPKEKPAGYDWGEGKGKNPYSGFNGNKAYTQAGFSFGGREKDSDSDAKQKNDWWEQWYDKDKKKFKKEEKTSSVGLADNLNKITTKAAMGFLTKLLSQDITNEDNLPSILKVLDKRLFPNGVQSEYANEYFNQVSNSATEFYSKIFMGDAEYKYFDETLETCQHLLENFETGYPELVGELVVSLNLEVKE